MVQPLRKAVWRFLIKLNVHVPHDPAVPLLDVYLREMKIHLHVKPYTNVNSSSVRNHQKLETAQMSFDR